MQMIDAMVAATSSPTKNNTKRAEPAPAPVVLPTEETKPEITATVEELETLAAELAPVADGHVIKMGQAANLIKRIRAANLHHGIDVTATGASLTHAYGQQDWTITNAGAVIKRIREVVGEPEPEDSFWLFDELLDAELFGEMPEGITIDDIAYFRALGTVKA